MEQAYYFMIKNILKYLRVFLLSFLISWLMLDIRHLLQGDMGPLKRKGIQVEWLIQSRQTSLSDTEYNVLNDKFNYIGVKITYTYVEPISQRGSDSYNN